VLELILVYLTLGVLIGLWTKKTLSKTQYEFLFTTLFWGFIVVAFALGLTIALISVLIEYVVNYINRKRG
jgi:hypothetical protein